jgi:hypothetical protein
VWEAIALCLMAAGMGWATPMVGANVSLVGLSGDAQQTELARLARDGAKSVRLELDWNRVEPKPGILRWEADDAAVDAALAQGLEVVLVLGPCAQWAVDPAWEVPADQARFSVPKSSDTWERYVREAVRHFLGRVRHWQVRERPDVRRFRGARGEYLRLFTAAATAARRVDPKAVIVMPEAGSLEVGEAARLSSEPLWSAVNAVGVYVSSRGGNLSSEALPWAVLRNEVMREGQTGGSRGEAATRPAGKPTRAGRQVWVLGSDEEMGAEEWVQQYVLAAAFGAERCYLPADSISLEWTGPLSGASYLGFLELGPEVWAFAFTDEAGPFVVAWSAREVQAPVSDIAPVADAEAVKAAAPLGGAAGSAVEEVGGEMQLKLGPRPILIRGLEVEARLRPGAPTRGDVLAARAGPKLGSLPVVYADYSMTERPEFGLYNRALRRMPGGETEEEMRGVRNCVRTHMQAGAAEEAPDSPWIYFDVDDGWMYCDGGKSRVVITVDCEGSFLGRQKLGFNIMYDSTSGYRFTRWQWVEPGQDWHRYQFELRDASFANRSGYDFRINAKGSKQDLRVAAVMIEKVAEAAPSEVASPKTARP